MSNVILSKSKFIHIPKCGGTAIESALWATGCVKNAEHVIRSPHYGHLFASQMPEDDKPNFTFIRHPVTWWESWYHWNKSQPNSRFNAEELKTRSFDEWINDYGQFWLGLYSKIVDRYMGLDPNFPTSNKVTHVGRTEKLYDDLMRILEELDEPYKKAVLISIKEGSHVRSRMYTNVQKYEKNKYSQATADIIYQTELPIFDKFGYEKIIK